MAEYKGKHLIRKCLAGKCPFFENQGRYNFI